MMVHITNTNNPIDFPKAAMINKIEMLAKEANAWFPTGYPSPTATDEAWQNLVIFEREDLEKFVELVKQAIYDDVKEELMDDSIINEEPDRVSREYLKGCNGGTVDALYHIKNFGVDQEQ